MTDAFVLGDVVSCVVKELQNEFLITEDDAIEKLSAVLFFTAVMSEIKAQVSFLISCENI